MTDSARAVSRSPALDAAGTLPTAERTPVSDRLPRPWMFPLLAFAAAWVLIITGWNVASAVYGYRMPWGLYFAYRDSAFYASIARFGYSTLSSAVPPDPVPSVSAFFPLYPAVIRLVMYVTGAGVIVAGLISQVLVGAASAVAVWALASHVYGHRVADRSVLLYCAFPGAMTLGMMYSEPLAVLLAASCLLAALKRKWLSAGLLALLAGAEHSTMIVLAPALGVAALHAIWARRDWRSLAAPALAPLGMLGYFAYLGYRYHDYLFWFRLERAGWNMHIDFGAHELSVLMWSYPLAPKYPLAYGLMDCLFWIALIGIMLLIAARAPWPITLYTALVLISCWISPVDVKPRFGLTMLGIFLGYAAKLPKWAFWPALAVSAGVLAFIAGYWPHHVQGTFPSP